MDRTPLLQLSSLSVQFGNKTVVEGVDLQLFRGEALALVGMSGSGKSATAHAIMNLLGPGGRISQGEIWFNGEALQHKTQHEMQRLRGRQIGMVFQDPMCALNPTLKVGWQIAEVLVFHQKVSWKEAQKQAITLLGQVEMADPERVFHAYPFQLSGGMLQRVMLAGALSCHPLLLIADEPTTALDVTIQAEILALLKRLKAQFQMSLLLITHDLSIVPRLCDRIAVMQHGRLSNASLPLRDFFTTEITETTEEG